jgi:hypothetical protein
VLREERKERELTREKGVRADLKSGLKSSLELNKVALDHS